MAGYVKEISHASPGSSGSFDTTALEAAIAALAAGFFSDSAAVTSVAGNASSTTLLTANANRKSAVLFNDSTAIAYVKFGTTASATSFTYKVDPGGTLELSLPAYRGRIDCIWSAADGNMRITELT